MSRICIVCPHHISSQPRSLREADTLAEHGHEVVVISRQTDPSRTAEDERLASTRAWKLRSVVLHRSGPTRHRWFANAARSELAGRLLRAGLNSTTLAIETAVRGASSLTQLALDWPADLYIAHTQLALPIAAASAEAHGAGLGFDCEDLLAESGTDAPEAIRAIESAYVPRCDYVTAASQAMADRLEEQYSVSVEVLYNVFPLRLRGDMRPPSERPSDGVLRLFWFGQTIGVGRGLEEAAQAVGNIGGGVELHLRGRVDPAYQRHLEEIAGGHQRLFFHSPLPHDELIRSFDRYDVGLALEDPNHSNYGVTVTNKLFSYALAGLAVLATDTEGQREALAQMPGVGTVVGLEGVGPDVLSAWIDGRSRLDAARDAAWEQSQATFNWDVHSGNFSRLVDDVVGALASRNERLVG